MNELVLSKLPKLNDEKNTAPHEFSFYSELGKYFDHSIGNNIDKLSNFSKYVPRQNLTTFLVKYEIFKKILNVHGSILECGVFLGGGLMTFAQISSILEPINHQRKIIGFDTFSGFETLSSKDHYSTSSFAKKGGLKINSYADLKECISIYDSNRFLNHIPKVELVKGNITKTLPQYLKNNPHTVVSLLYLDMDVYKPTKFALKNLLMRIPKGGIIVFDELNSKEFVGETLAVMDTVGIHNLRIERFSFDTHISYAILE